MTLFESGLLENRDSDQENDLKFFDIDFKAKKKFSALQKPNSLVAASAVVLQGWPFGSFEYAVVPPPLSKLPGHPHLVFVDLLLSDFRLDVGRSSLIFAISGH